MILRDSDVASYYPSMILKYRIVPEHLDEEKFLTTYDRIIKERLEAKQNGNKVKDMAKNNNQLNISNTRN